MLKYFIYKILYLCTVGETHKKFRKKCQSTKAKINNKRLYPIIDILNKLENYEAYHRYYLMFKQRFNISIPAELCGCGNHFDLVSVKLKDLKRYWPDGSLHFLNEGSQFRYLKSKDPKIYLNYLKRHVELGGLSPDSLWWSLDDFKKLAEKIKKEGYRPEISAIGINKENTVLDGVHRASILLFLHGEEYQIPVIRVSKK